VPPNVVFAGRLSDQELRSLMQSALCLLCPSLTEGFGLPPLEAMLLGTPAVVSTIRVFAELCGDAAVQASPGDPGSWSAAVTRFATDPSFRSHMAERGRARASAFTWERAARRLLEVSAHSLAIPLPWQSTKSPTGYWERLDGTGSADPFGADDRRDGSMHASRLGAELADAAEPTIGPAPADANALAPDATAMTAA
jgi:hypothetical protein